MINCNIIVWISIIVGYDDTVIDGYSDYPLVN